MAAGRPRVSVIIPTYNRAALLGAAIDSVLAQTFQNFEIIVADDGSTDATGDLVRDYSARDARVRYVRLDHAGISAALNAGIRASAGALIARVDSDDKWMPNLLEVTVAALDARPKIGFAYGKSQWFSGDLEIAETFTGHAPAFPGDPVRSLLWGDPTCSITVVARRECFDRVGFYDESLATSEDWDMSLRLAWSYDFAFLDRVLALHRAHAASATLGHSDEPGGFLAERHKVLDSFFRRADLPPRVAAMKTIAYRNLYVFQGNIWLGQRRWRPALAAYARALATGNAPLDTLARIVWFGFFVRVLEKTAGGRRFLRWQSEWRRARSKSH